MCIPDQGRYRHRRDGTARARPLRRVGVAGRLMVLALLPLLAICLLSAPLAWRTSRDAARAAEVDRQVPELTSVLGAFTSAVGEQSAALSVTYEAATGVSPVAANAVLGVNMVSELRAAEVATDRAFSLLPPALTKSLWPDLAEVRDLVRSKAPDAQAVGALYQRVEATLGTTATGTLASVEDKMAQTSEGTALSRSLVALDDCYDFVQASAAEDQDDSAALMGRSVAARNEGAFRLAEDMGQYEKAGHLLAASAVPAVASAWRSLIANSSVRAYIKLLMDAAHGMPLFDNNGGLNPASGTIPIETLAGGQQGIGTYWRLTYSLVAGASTSLRHASGALAASDVRAYRLWLVLMALVGAGAPAVALMVARSISVPLNRLAAAARSVVGGHLGEGQLAVSGPAETAVVADAFNSLMSNLRLMEAKAHALANCDFDNEVLSTPLPGELGAALQGSVSVLAGSIQDRQQLQERLAHEATHDALTGLLNRAAATSALEQALARARRRADTTALFYLDLDNFKQANDAHGHHVGDEVLRQVGARLASAVRSGDVVARIGGDEFIVIAERAEGQRDIEALAARLVTMVSGPVTCGTVELSLGVSIGIALEQGDQTGPLQLLAQADMALYQAKRRAGNHVEFYNAVLQQRLATRAAVEHDLRADLAHGGGGLVLYYQPLVDMGRALHGVECLIRWERPGHGFVQPDVFIPVAEASDLIIEVDKWVLKQAARQLAAWAADPVLGGVGLSVNISGRHLLSQQLPENLRLAILESGADPHLLTIEITETVLLDDLSVVAAQLESVRRLGVQVAVDDFGTGYTSLAHLHRLPVDSIKIDRTFIAGVETPSDASLVRMMTELAHQLGFKAVSEGVETVEQFEALREIGTDTVQGFLIARPMPVDSLRAWAEAALCAPPAA